MTAGRKRPSGARRPGGARGGAARPRPAPPATRRGAPAGANESPAGTDEAPADANAPTDAGAAPAGEAPPASPVAELVLRIAGVAVSATLAFVVAAYGAFLTPFRIGTVLVPVSLVIAVLGNVGLVWFAYTVTRSRLLALVPGVVFVAVTVVASLRTTDGDLVLTSSNWVSAGYLLAVPVTVAGCAYRLYLPSRRW